MGLMATFKLVTADSGGGHTMIETTVPAGFAGAPAHRNRSINEKFYVLDGELTVRAGDQAVTAARGAYAYVPRSVVHTFANCGDWPDTFLDIVHPADFERYYRDLAAAFLGEQPLLTASGNG